MRSCLRRCAAALPRRIARLTATVTFPSAVSSPVDLSTRKELERIAENCPVRLSLSDQIECVLTFDWL